MVEMGWTALIIPEKFNGLNFGYVGLGQILEETGKNLCKSPLISSCLLSSSVINLCDNEVLKAREFPLIMNGTKTMTLAIEENSYHKPYDFRTRAKLEGDNYRINGLKTFVIDGSTSDEIILVTEIAEGEIGFFIINREQKGIGKNVNIGAGTITCNFDGHKKHKTIIKDGAFIGSNTSLVAPVIINKNAKIGAGSVINKDIPAEKLAIERSKLKIIKKN